MVMEAMRLSLLEHEETQRKEAEERKKKAEELFSKKRLGEGDLELDKDKLASALSEERKRKARGDDDDDRFGKKQRGHAGHSSEVTEEELGKFIWLECSLLMAHTTAEAYRMNRRMTDDPMANYVDADV